MKTRLLLLLFVSAALLAGCSGSRSTSSENPELPPTVLLISFDGFRWDYPQRYETPHLDRLAEEGLRAERLVPVFPTKTFPNHYTLVTGLYPENHGIVGNTMYDPVMDAWFSLGNQEAVTDARWWGGEPLWVTAEEQGQIAATYFWPGSEAPIDGVRPTYWTPYDGSVPGEARVEQVLAWLSLPPAERPTLLTLYFSRVDSEGHEHGPEAPEVARAVREVDALLGQLLDGLAARGLTKEVNLIVVSDHGMTATSPERVILLDEYVDPGDVRVITYSPVLMLYPEEGKADSVFAALRGAHPHMAVYRKEDVPERLHYSAHRRIPPIIGIADAGWSISTSGYLEENPGRFAGGAHGYAPQAASMHGIFYARGPAFPEDVTIGRFHSVDLYALITEILDLEPAPNDGDPQAAHRLLRTSEGG